MQELADKERAFNTKAMADFAKAQQERMGVFERKVATDNDASAKAMQAQMAELAKGHRTEWVRDTTPACNKRTAWADRDVPRLVARIISQDQRFRDYAHTVDAKTDEMSRMASQAASAAADATAVQKVGEDWRPKNPVPGAETDVDGLGDVENGCDGDSDAADARPHGKARGGPAAVAAGDRAGPAVR